MSAPTLEQRQAAACRTLSVAGLVQAAHTPARPGYCACGRTWPCSVADTCRRARAAGVAELAQLQHLPHAPTVLLPAIRDTPPAPGPRRRWRIIRARRRRARH